MAIISLKDGCEDVEWIDDDNIDEINCENLVGDTDEANRMHVFSMDEYFTFPWTDN